jgi:multidrug efflux pump
LVETVAALGLTGIPAAKALVRVRATETQAKRFEAILAKDEDVATFVGYVGNGSPRYYLSLDQQLFRPNFAQFVVLTKDVAGRDRALPRLRRALDDEFPGIRARAFRTPLGPPVAYPVQFRVLGSDPQRLKAIGEQVAEVIRADPSTLDVHADWGERAPAVRIDVDQDKARVIGLSSGQVARAIGGAVSGATIGTFRERDKLIEVVLRAPAAERASLANLSNLQIQTSLGRSVPLSQVASVTTCGRCNWPCTMPVRAPARRSPEMTPSSGSRRRPKVASPSERSRSPCARMCTWV